MERIAFDSSRSSLSPAQLDAVTATEGFVRVIAGAGSGKTRALVHRFAYLVNEFGILPGNILCVTFTNKAANEMRQRIHALIGDNDTGYINTFHGFCVSVLQEESYAIGYPKSFLVLDNGDIDDMLKLIYEERGLTLRDMTFSAARDMFEMQKLKRKPDYFLDLIALPLDELREKYLHACERDEILFYGYLYLQRKCFGLDYNDLLILTMHIFAEHPDVRLKWQKRLAYIMIDEFQDIDEIQYKLMEVLCGYHQNLFIVGDPDQTIYTWRGANVKFLLDFDRRFPRVKTIFLNENYRSTPEILSVCNSLIGKNKDRIKKDLVPMLPHGTRVVCHHAQNAEAEARRIADEMDALHAAGVAYRDMTVLYRAHYVTRPIEEVFLSRKLPYAIYSGVPFFGRAEIKDALCYLRMLVYADDLAFRRVVNTPKRNLGRRRLAFLEETAAQRGCTLYEALRASLDHETLRGTQAEAFVRLIEGLAEGLSQRPVSETLAALLDRSGYEAMLRTEGSQDRLDNLAELKQSVFEYETTCGEEATAEHYLQHVALFTSGDAADPGDKVRLMTVHAAKGLEFPYVFLAGMNEGVFPSRKVRTLAGMEEERRLAFVAMTRAERGLFLSEAEGFTHDGTPRYPSRFLLDIDRDLLDFTTPPEEGLIRDAKQYIQSAERALEIAEQAQNALPVGARVRHPLLGDGTVIGVDETLGAHEIQFDALPTPRKLGFRAKLERI